MHCTQGAVSRQISSLEEALGVTLFERNKQGLELTAAGAYYLQAITPALSQIEAASLQLLSSGGRGGALNVAVFPTFNAKWLIPRLLRFYTLHPQIVLNLLPQSQAYDFSQPETDASIRFGSGEWGDCTAHYLIGRDVVAVVSPQLLRARKGKLRPQDLLEIGLLHHMSVPHAWSEWFAQFGIQGLNLNIGKRFDQFTLIIQAVVAGLGAALVPRILVEDELLSGRVTLASSAAVRLQQGYFLCFPASKSEHPQLLAFRKWIEDEAKMDLDRVLPQ